MAVWRLMQDCQTHLSFQLSSALLSIVTTGKILSVLPLSACVSIKSKENDKSERQVNEECLCSKCTVEE
jgi:hypothetical protein